MPVNHLEQLISEWLEYRGYFVKRNQKVGRRARGGYDCEIDVAAYHPETRHLVQYEPSTDTHSWAKRNARFRKKFAAGAAHIPGMFHGIQVPSTVDQHAVFLYGSTTNNSTVGGGKILMVADLLKEISADLATKQIAKGIVPEQFALLRVLHLACEFRTSLFPK